jgi:PAS domain S-box-containing protein
MPIQEAAAMEITESMSYFQDLLEEPEEPELLRLTQLVARLFRVPVAYIGLLGRHERLIKRIGVGLEHSEFLKTNFPLNRALAAPDLMHDFATLPGYVMKQGEVRCAASIPLRASNGLVLGVLLIADLHPRPDFSDEDMGTLGELARVLAGKMELRLIASQALELELSLVEAEQRFQSLADSAPMMIICGSEDGACSFVNKRWLEFTGRKTEEELGEGWTDTIHPENRQSLHEHYWQAFQKRQSFQGEVRMRRHDGVYRRMLGSGVPRVSSDGKFAGFVGCLIDVTDCSGEPNP